MTFGIAGSTWILILHVLCARWTVLQMAILGMRSCIDGRNERWRWLTSVTGDSTSLLLWEWGTHLTWHTLSQVRWDTLPYSQISLGMLSFHLIQMCLTFRGICHPDNLFWPESEDGLLHHSDLHPLQHDRGPVLGLLLDQQGCSACKDFIRYLRMMIYEEVWKVHRHKYFFMVVCNCLHSFFFFFCQYKNLNKSILAEYYFG